MSKFTATIREIVQVDDLHIITAKHGDITLTMITLELGKEVQVGRSVMLCVKATAVAIAKDFSGTLSYSNQIDLEIEHIEQGALLCALELQEKDFALESIITKASLQRMQLKEGERVTALIKSSDLSILEVL